MLYRASRLSDTLAFSLRAGPTSLDIASPVHDAKSNKLLLLVLVLLLSPYSSLSTTRLSTQLWASSHVSAHASNSPTPFSSLP